MSTHRNRPSLALLLLSSALFATSARADVITDWNTVALDAVIALEMRSPHRREALPWFTSPCSRPSMPSSNAISHI
jgi:hypothetical protein